MNTAIVPSERRSLVQHPAKHDRVTINFTGWTADGAMFDSSSWHRAATSVRVDEGIEGWTEGLQQMTLGSKSRFWIPEDLAYNGRAGSPAGMLVFDIELIAIDPMPAPPPVPEDVAGPPKDAKRTASGLKYRFLKRSGATARPDKDSQVEVDYTGWTADGKMFDSSVVRGRPATLSLPQTLPGLAEGIELLAVGDVARLWVPEALSQRTGQATPAGRLVFDVTLRRILADADETEEGERALEAAKLLHAKSPPWQLEAARAEGRDADR